jgi:uncharacterized protein (DUF2345 family)
MRAWIMTIAALTGPLACSSPNASKTPHAALQVSFGGSAAMNLEVPAVTSATQSRLLLQASDHGVTVFASFALPLTGSTIALAADPQNVSIWAKQGSGAPLIAQSGNVSLNSDAGLLNLSFSDIAKPSDTAGESLLVVGTIDDVPAPR